MSFCTTSRCPKSIGAKTTLKKVHLSHIAGLNKLSIAISIGKFIVANEAKGPVQDSFIQKIKELMIRRD